MKDLVVHVRDISHPECDAQLEDVMTVLEKQLSIKAPLIDNMVEAQNKIDLWYALLTTCTSLINPTIPMKTSRDTITLQEK